MTDSGHYYVKGGRRDRNERSKSNADRNNEPWVSDEDALIMLEWISFDNQPEKRPEVGIATRLGRTAEACRNRAEVLRRRYNIQINDVLKKYESKEDKPYIGAYDDPEDRYW